MTPSTQKEKGKGKIDMRKLKESIPMSATETLLKREAIRSAENKQKIKKLKALLKSER